MAAMQGKIQMKLLEMLDILSSVDGIVNGHIAGFFTHNLWKNTIPPSVIQDLDNLNNLSDFIPIYFRFLSDPVHSGLENLPNLENFLITSTREVSDCFGLFYTQTNKLFATMSDLGAVTAAQLELKDFMSEKKKHEVEKLVPMTEALSNLTGTSCIVDIGGGKGYLSSSLAKYCGFQVLALDSSSETITGAEKLERKMAKAAGRSKQDLHRFQREKVLVSPGTDLKPLLLRYFGPQSPNVGLVGLHTCGDLAPTCLHHFLRENFRWIVNVGCCYHLLEEEFEQPKFWSDLSVSSDFGFPVSLFLRERKVKLGRNARMLAAHSLEKMLENGVSEESARSLFFRALLQVLIERVRGHDLVEGQVGRLAGKCANFNQYIRRAVQKLELDVSLTDSEIENLMSEYACDEIKIKIYFHLRTHFAPLVECVILLDRLLFLLEEGIENAYLVPLFDPTLSPRNHALIAWKSAKTAS